jgi:hypothetical protein
MSEPTESPIDFCNGLEALAVNLRRQLQVTAKTEAKASILEENFSCLTYEKQTGAKLGEYEVAFKSHNLPDKFSHALGILKQNNAVIDHRFHLEGYTFAYWLYGEEKIYRKKLGESEVKKS